MGLSPGWLTFVLPNGVVVTLTLFLLLLLFFRSDDPLQLFSGQRMKNMKNACLPNYPFSGTEG